MKEKPILFSGPMIRALLSGRKTMTRRIVKPQPTEKIIDMVPSPWHGSAAWASFQSPGAWNKGNPVYCPYGDVGGQLWVKETFYAWGRWETRYSEKKGRDEWHFVDMTEPDKPYLYEADGVDVETAKDRSGVSPGYWKRPSIFMPRQASRITLEITAVRVERLQAISEADAKAEGASLDTWFINGPSDSDHIDISGLPGTPAQRASYRNGFANLWQSINGPGSWDNNPFVWVVSFKLLEVKGQ